ncbi:hypothetical protein RJZ56_001453 [Blastomyces dermatitidis]
MDTGSSICAAQSNTYHPISAKGPPGFVSDKHCKNSPKNRACWGGGFDITTNFGTKWPETGKVVEVCRPSFDPKPNSTQNLPADFRFVSIFLK